MTPEAALERVLHCFDRAYVTGHRARAVARALDVVRSTTPDELARRAEEGSLTGLAGIGDTTAEIIAEALRGEVPTYVVELERSTQVKVSAEAQPYRAALRGDLHVHSTWSDGSTSIRRMAETARDLGHEYLVITDHSARLTVAHGLDRDRLCAQLDEIAEVNAELAPFRVLSGIEVDIHPDGSLDLDDDLLARLDVVVASVHSKLALDAPAMTARMVEAVRSPHVDVLGHCTGRLLERRAPSRFDPEEVFAACAAHGTAVEINSRPERLDPPADLLAVALAQGCLVAISSDAHSTGQLEWQPLGCERAAELHVALDRIVNTWSADELLGWVAA